MDIVVISDKHNLVRRNHVVKVFGKKFKFSLFRCRHGQSNE